MRPESDPEPLTSDNGVYTVDSTMISDAGRYYCVASNTLDTVNDSRVVMVTGTSDKRFNCLVTFMKQFLQLCLLQPQKMIW